MNNKSLSIVAAILILVLASGLRFWHVTDGYDQVCRLPQQELWLYDYPQPTSLYNYDASPVIYEEEIAHIPYTRTALPHATDLLAARLLGALGGVVTVGLMLAYAQILKHPSGWLAALWIAVAPWFVWVDQWAIRFDFAVLAVAVTITALAYQNRKQAHTPEWVYPLIIGSAFSLLLIAPPLWWLTCVFFALALWREPQKLIAWRWAFFFVFAGILLVPSLRSPMHWLDAALKPDLGTTAALIWAGLALMVWRWRRVSWPGLAVTGLVILVSSGATLFWQIHRTSPTEAEEALIHYLQDRIYDGSVVRFDASTWPLVDEIACPALLDLHFTAQPEEIVRTYIPGIHLHPPDPDYIVTSQSGEIVNAPWVEQVGPYTVGRMIALPNATDILFGDVVRLIGYEMLTPQVQPGQLFEMRLDLQFAPQLDERVLANALFVHLTRPNQPDAKIINISLPFTNMLDVVGSRRLAVGRRAYGLVPPETPPGVYDVLLGVYNIYDGKRVGSIQGEVLTLGQIRITD